MAKSQKTHTHTQALDTLSLLARQTVFTQETEAVDTRTSVPTQTHESTLLLADASVFHPMPEATRQTPQTEIPNPEGYDAGFTAGQAQSDRVYQETIAMMEGVLEALKSDMNSMRGAIEESHAKAVRDILSAVLPDLGHQALIAEIEKVLKQGTSEALEGTVEARLHPENRALKTFFEEKHTADISVVLDDTQSPTGVAFIWNGGGVDIDPKRVVHACLDLLGGETSMNADAKNISSDMESDGI